MNYRKKVRDWSLSGPNYDRIMIIIDEWYNLPCHVLTRFNLQSWNVADVKVKLDSTIVQMDSYCTRLLKPFPGRITLLALYHTYHIYISVIDSQAWVFHSRYKQNNYILNYLAYSSVPIHVYVFSMREVINLLWVFTCNYIIAYNILKMKHLKHACLHEHI